MHYFERYKQHLDSLIKEKNNRWDAVLVLLCWQQSSCSLCWVRASRATMSPV